MVSTTKPNPATLLRLHSIAVAFLFGIRSPTSAEALTPSSTLHPLLARPVGLDPSSFRSPLHPVPRGAALLLAADRHPSTNTLSLHSLLELPSEVGSREPLPWKNLCVCVYLLGLSAPLGLRPSTARLKNPTVRIQPAGTWFILGLALLGFQLLINPRKSSFGPERANGPMVGAHIALLFYLEFQNLNRLRT